MTPETVIDIGQRALELTAVLMLVLLMPALVVGVLVSVLQAATQVNESTLSFLPKMLVTMVVLLVAGPLILTLLTDYMRALYQGIPGLIG
jgi:flagellar biosynthesis protein FliQ